MFCKYLILLIFLFPLAAAAQVYRWVDERGVTHYGEKPPANRAAKTIDARPAAASVDSEGKLIEASKPPAKAAPAPQAVLLPPPAPPAPPVRGMDFGVYTQLRQGMSEGEVLLRAGRPDHETFDGGRHFVVKSLYYYPTIADPFITVVTIRGGRVAAIERTRKM
ncbi:MAG: DUF4124 domain-containing protein [Betaproteobacteria bacterium]|nr:DUF4124 domain-containing protein [Betaproteobacteria bacterium]